MILQVMILQVMRRLVIRIYIGGIKSWGRNILFGVGLMASCSAVALAADPITGVAHNQTRNRPAAGDEVILLRLDQGMQEEARTMTDSQGSFTLKVRYPNALHLVRPSDNGDVARVRTCSALLGEGIDELWSTVEELVARIDAATRIREGDEAELWADLRSMHLFDPATGRNITLDDVGGTGGTSAVVPTSGTTDGPASLTTDNA
jgi:hypothetical protein